MKEVWRFLSLEIRNGYWNMALDEAILEGVIEKTSPYSIRLYKWKPSTVSIGRNQSLSSEVDLETARKKGYNIVRRITGGGAVFHDAKGEITYSIVCPVNFLANLGAKRVMEQFEIITQGIIEGLREYGLKPEKGVIHCPAIFLEGKKFSGNAQTRKRGILLQHGTILLDIDPDEMYSVLTPPPTVTKSRMVQSVKAKCIGIRERLGEFEENRFVSSLKIGFENVLGVQLKNGKFIKEEKSRAKQLVNEKYKRKEWLQKYE